MHNIPTLRAINTGITAIIITGNISPPRSLCHLLGIFHTHQVHAVSAGLSYHYAKTLVMHDMPQPSATCT